MAGGAYPPPGPLGQTDPYSWRLDSTDSGRHNWYYLGKDGTIVPNELPIKGAVRDQSPEDAYWLGLPTGAPNLPDPKGDPLKAAKNGFSFLKRLQSPDGHWAGEYGGPLFLTPGLVISCYVTNTPLPSEWKVELARYLANTQRDNGQEDSGWGLHIAGASSVFGTALNYVSLRLLGVDAEEQMMVKARATLHALGGATGNPAWGKFWLSVLNVYDWEGNNSWPPELWLLPTWIPIHPSRWWIHCRNVYIPMSFIGGMRFKAPEDPLILSLRKELYTVPYESIDWPKQRNNVAASDLHTPHSFVLDLAFLGLGQWDSRFCPQFIRSKGLDFVYDLVCKEDENTGYQDLGPVNKPMHLICRYIRDGADSESIRLHREKLRDFVWMSEEGAMMTGTNGSQLWDISFISLALSETGLAYEPENRDSVCKMLAWLDQCQMTENPKHYESAFRHATKGAWPFSTKEQGYTVSDCTAEGLKAVLSQQELDFTPKLVSKRRLCDAADILLSMQNADGSYASYELIRGYRWLEYLNAAEVFRNIMIEYPYPECTTSVLTGLARFHQNCPDYRSDDIRRAIDGAAQYIRRSQRTDGSWFGSWAICFTYAMQFALESLAAVGETWGNSDAVKRACGFLLSKQRKDGGWGESYKACVEGVYIQSETSQVTQTSWALLALLRAGCPEKDAIRRGCKFIMSRQQSDGSWPQENINGIFNKTVTISYPLYKFSWTIWALGVAHKELGPEWWA